MYPQPVVEVAQALVARRKEGCAGARFEEQTRPASLVDALLIQDAVSHYWCEDMDDSIGGWKCALPSNGKLVLAPIYTRTIDSIAPVALWPTAGKALIEPELAFFLNRDFPVREQPYSPAEIDAAIGRTHMALELIFNRYDTAATCDFAEILADGLVNQGLFIGPQVDSTRVAAAAAISIDVAIVGEDARQLAGVHPNGNPRAPLYWLVEFLRSQGKAIQAGQAIITGSYAGLLEVPLHRAIRITYAGLGDMDISFTPR